MKKFNLAKILSLVFVCVMLVGALAITAFATEDEKVEILAANVYYGEYYKIAVAVNAPEGAVVTAKNSQGVEIEVIPFADQPTVDYKGVTCKNYILKTGVAAQAIDEVFTFTVTYGERTAYKNVSVLQYIYVRSQMLSEGDAELEMLQALLNFAIKADIFLDKTPADSSFNAYQYVNVTGATVNGVNPTGMYAKGATPFANIDAIEYDAEKYELAVTVNGAASTLDALKALAVADEAINVVVEIVEKTHVHNYTPKVTDPTCTEGGYTTYTCACGHSYTGNETEAKGHTTEQGICGNCGEQIGEVKTSNKEYTFSGAGTQYAENEEHVLDHLTTIYTTECHYTSELRIYSSSTHNGFVIIQSTKSITAISVNAGYKDKADTLVVYGSNDEGANWTSVAEISVTSTSYNDYEADLGGSYKWIKLDVKGDQQIRLKSMTLTTIDCAHGATETVTIEAGCETAGYEIVKCTSCNEELNKTEIAKATGHSYGEPEVTKEASCTDDGVKTSVCGNCGDKKEETIEATGHTTEKGVCGNCGEEIGGTEEPTPSEPQKLVTFEFGTNGSATHADGNDLGTSITYTEGDYTLKLTGMSKVYGPAYDAKGNSCIKLGTSSKTGSFTFTVGEDVDQVIIRVAKYKANTTKYTINGGTAQTVNTNSNDGAYTEIVIDTTATKTITFATASGGVRAMIDSITFIG